MISLPAAVARDALLEHVVVAGPEEHPSQLEPGRHRDTLYAVFEAGTGGAPEGRLLGLVDARQAAIYPLRIFADLVPAWQPEPIPADMPLEQVQQRLLEDSVSALPVLDARGRFLGAVTRESVFAALAEHGRRTALGLRETLELQERQLSLVALEIHDGILQYAAAAKMHLELSASLQAGMGEEAEVQMIRSLALLKETITEARALMQGLQPPVRGQLSESLRYLIETRRSPAGPELSLQSDGRQIDLPVASHLAVFRIVQEALSNALKHSRSPRIEVQVGRQAERVEIVIRDWGLGFDPHQAKAGHGLAGMRHRARLLSGDVYLSAAPGQGTTLRLSFPLPGTADSAGPEEQQQS